VNVAAQAEDARRGSWKHPPESITTVKAIAQGLGRVAWWRGWRARAVNTTVIAVGSENQRLCCRQTGGDQTMIAAGPELAARAQLR